MNPIIDPRGGDAEDDACSSKKRSLFAIAGSLLGEINLPKLALAWVILALIPGVLLGLVPLIATAWFSSVSDRVHAIAGIGSLMLLALVAAIGWYAFRPLFRVAERNFWSLNSLVVQPGYALCREGLRHLAERFLSHDANEARRAYLRAATAIGAGVLACGVASAIALTAWPHTRWSGGMADLADPLRLVVPALANTVSVMAAYLAAASLTWGIADGSMDQPRDLVNFDKVPANVRRWRVAHLSDIHVVGERYGFRIESGRAGPRGNERLHEVLARLDAVHARDPLDLLLITGDMTDAGRSAEWAEFLDAMARHPALAARSFILPGNHDVNIVDRANPARLELPGSAGKTLRQMRALSAMDTVQGSRVHVVDPAESGLGAGSGLGVSLAEALEPHRIRIAAFADTGGFRLSMGLGDVWARAFPMVLPPAEADGLGVVLLNSNAETHFSFTNALGMVGEEDMRAMLSVLAQFPKARWIIALHHHPVEYPMPAAFSERVGTALINGSFFVRQLKPHGHRIVAMHGHRHVDWVGRCGPLKIISAPSPVMEATDSEPTHFYIHTLAAAPDGGLALLEPERIDMTSGPVSALSPELAVS
ncbi:MULTISPECIES: metallophosphoesterase [unclassified Chelatococcus]|uniref:metallophosphoesterase family protein n=1 Tax=unclassified Chelatococcus TaxID=2638111 RepID=UPI001BCD763C|nr:MULTISPECIES: metallophosphoesterase [unclassified Chelatococcus]CAH1672037.1 Calcineurin-like phosphoesterase family protein [Hyphomicrobiales bacterium]MBS7738540.1 metallophosphoesterase [Chelatococcus sp. HY11]MBX3542944.1 metallophosphoesterase [Chelatococcus sp.]MCO5076929.1 metallophosphoesterase [Chelatococcus sp.]CAH1675734.1 Calcineurin-like phosphoesterase family protein [Hyphomicrobiales bacterium]